MCQRAVHTAVTINISVDTSTCKQMHVYIYISILEQIDLALPLILRFERMSKQLTVIIYVFLLQL